MSVGNEQLMIGIIDTDITAMGNAGAASINNTPINGFTSVANDVSNPAVNIAAVITYNAQATKKHYLHCIYCSYDAAPTGGYIQVEDVSGIVVFKQKLAGTQLNQILFDKPIVSAAVNTALIVTLTAAGAAVTGSLNCRHEVR